jgi:hypothetical protein
MDFPLDFSEEKLYIPFELSLSDWLPLKGKSEDSEKEPLYGMEMSLWLKIIFLPPE